MQRQFPRMMSADDLTDRNDGLNEETEGSLPDGGHALGPIVVVKIGGSTFGTNDTTMSDLVDLQRGGVRPVVVHGGGKVITEWLERQGIRPKFVKGLRVTDDRTLDVVIAVLTGIVNKSLVQSINDLGGIAVGLSGVDGEILHATAQDPELGHVGTINKVDPSVIDNLLSSGSIPVLAPVAVNTGSGCPRMLNVNADLAAGEVAAALGASRLLMLTDVPGVLDSSKRVIPRVTKRQARGLMKSNIVAGGMIPKLEACLKALSAGSMAQIVDGRRSHVLLENIESDGAGSSERSPGTRVG